MIVAYRATGYPSAKRRTCLATQTWRSIVKRGLFFILLVVVLAGVGAAWAGGPGDVLPWGRPAAKNEEMPLPMGVGLTFYWQSQDYSLDRWQASSPIPEVNAMIAQLSAGVDALSIENETIEENVKFDVWLLPFLNVFALLGNIDGQTDIKMMPPLPKIEVDYNGIVYGGGAVLAGGWKEYFASLTGIYTGTELDEQDSTINAWVLQPRVGAQLKGPGEKNNVILWLGAMYQQVTEEHKGSINITGLGPVDYNVRLKDDTPWNYLAGVALCVGRNVEISLEGGFGDRQNVELTGTYRF